MLIRLNRTNSSIPLTNAVATRVRMEQIVLTLSIRTHALASRVTLEHIARQVRVCDNQTYTDYYEC